MNNTLDQFVNLVPVECSRKRQLTMWVRRWALAAMTTAFVIGIPGLYIGGSAVLTDSGISGQIEDANLKYTQNQQSIPLLQEKLGLLKAEQEVLSLVKNRIEWREVFGVLVESAGNEVRFRRLSAIGGGVEGASLIELSIEGLAVSQTVARAYIVDLENSEIFDRVELAETRREQVGEHELIGFQVLITISGSSTHLGKDVNDG